MIAPIVRWPKKEVQVNRIRHLRLGVPINCNNYIINGKLVFMQFYSLNYTK